MMGLRRELFPRFGARVLAVDLLALRGFFIPLS